MSDLGREAELYPATISNILNGNRGVGPAVARKIAKALKVDEDVVLYRAGLITQDPQSITEELDPIALDILQMLENRSEAEKAAALAALTALFDSLDRGTSGKAGGNREAASRSNKG